MNIALVDLPDQRVKLFPLTMTRPIGSLRVGILTIQEKWEYFLPDQPDLFSTELLNAKFQNVQAPYDLVINAGICPDQQIVDAIMSLEPGYVLYSKKGFVAAAGNFSQLEDMIHLDAFHRRDYDGYVTLIERAWDIFLNNSDQIKQDFLAVTENRESAPIEDKYTVVYGEENIFLEEGVKIRAAYLNAESGPIYISKNAEIQEGAAIRGPFFLGEGSRINLNSKIREGTSIGPGCKIGGEVSNSMIYANSNKAHGGFLGNSVIGEFCNLGAATNNSNLKNNYEFVKMWDYQFETFINTELQFCGLVMGDHSKSAIGTTFNTGTTVGVSCNIFGSGFPRNFIPSFSWGGASKLVRYSFEKAMATAAKVFDRKGSELDHANIEILKEIHDSQIKVGA